MRFKYNETETTKKVHGKLAIMILFFINQRCLIKFKDDMYTCMPYSSIITSLLYLCQ